MKRKILALIAGISLAFIPIVAYVCYAYCIPFAKRTNTLDELGKAIIASTVFAMLISGIVLVWMMESIDATNKQ